MLRLSHFPIIATCSRVAFASKAATSRFQQFHSNIFDQFTAGRHVSNLRVPTSVALKRIPTKSISHSLTNISVSASTSVVDSKGKKKRSKRRRKSRDCDVKKDLSGHHGHQQKKSLTHAKHRGGKNRNRRSRPRPKRHEENSEGADVEDEWRPYENNDNHLERLNGSNTNFQSKISLNAMQSQFWNTNGDDFSIQTLCNHWTPPSAPMSTHPAVQEVLRNIQVKHLDKNRFDERKKIRYDPGAFERAETTKLDFHSGNTNGGDTNDILSESTNKGESSKWKNIEQSKSDQEDQFSPKFAKIEKWSHEEFTFKDVNGEELKSLNSMRSEENISRNRNEKVNENDDILGNDANPCDGKTTKDIQQPKSKGNQSEEKSRKSIIASDRPWLKQTKNPWWMSNASKQQETK